MPRSRALAFKRSVNGAAASTDVPTRGAICILGRPVTAADCAGEEGGSDVAAVPAGALPVACMSPSCFDGSGCAACGVAAEVSTSLALLHEARTIAASNVRVLVSPRISGLKVPPWRTRYGLIARSSRGHGATAGWAPTRWSARCGQASWLSLSRSAGWSYGQTTSYSARWGRDCPDRTTAYQSMRG